MKCPCLEKVSRLGRVCLPAIDLTGSYDPKGAPINRTGMPWCANSHFNRI
jgi:hypothetical protein